MTQATAGGMHQVSGASAVGATSGAAAPSTQSNSAAPPVIPKEPVKQAPQVEAYEQLIQGPLTNYINLSKELGGLIAEQVEFHFPLPPPPPFARFGLCVTSCGFVLLPELEILIIIFLGSS